MIALCNKNDIDDPGALGLEIDHAGKTIELFIVHKDGHYSAYLNHCPHTGVNLNWVEHQFLDLDRQHIQCATHDALFEIPSGVCIYGPCVGQSLTALPLQIDEDSIAIDPQSLPSR